MTNPDFQRMMDNLPELPERGACPTPHKTAFGSRKIAKHALKRAKGRGDTTTGRRLHAYLCECGRFHLGNVPSVQTLERIRER